MVSAANEVLWADLASVLAVVVVERGLDRAALGIDIDTVPGCDGALRIDELR